MFCNPRMLFSPLLEIRLSSSSPSSLFFNGIRLNDVASRSETKQATEAIVLTPQIFLDKLLDDLGQVGDEALAFSILIAEKEDLQKFLFKFTGQDQEINLLGDGTEKAEFGEWSWMAPEQVIELAVDFKKPVYKEVLSVFAPHFQ